MDGLAAQFLGARELDHAVAPHLLPVGARTTRVRGYWLVNEDAREGVDYDLGTLMPFLHLTNEHAWEICRFQQMDVDSVGYEPRPLSRVQEYNVDAFIRWSSPSMSPTRTASR